MSPWGGCSRSKKGVGQLCDRGGQGRVQSSILDSNPRPKTLESKAHSIS